MNPARIARVYEPGFVYKKADSNHHIRATFDKAREEQRQQAEKASTVRTLRKKESK